MVTLLDAFQLVAPQTGDRQADRLRNEAARVLFEELSRLVNSTRLSHNRSADQREEVLATVLLRLVQSGPRGQRFGDPDSEQSVRRYLRVALENGFRDLLRAMTAQPLVLLRDTGPEAELPAPDSEGQPDRQLDRKRAALALDQALEDLRDVLLPALQTTLRRDASARLRTTVEELLGLYVGSLTLAQLRPAPENLTAPEQDRRARYARYQQYHRALETLLSGIDALAQEQRLSTQRCAALRALVRELQLRKDRSP